MKQWFVVQSKPKQETRAEVNLGQQGYETYCPRLIQRRRYRGRRKEVIEPLFPRYLFVRLEQGRDDFAPIRSTLGVTSLVRFGGVPGVLPTGIIEEIKAREDETRGKHVHSPKWQPGDEVEIVEGAFTGLKGLFLAESRIK
jgi:transcriptional antiterminator RfaH